jgi:hypothetical protein
MLPSHDGRIRRRAGLSPALKCLRNHAGSAEEGLSSLLVLITFFASNVSYAQEEACLDYASDPSQLVHLEAQATRGALHKPDIDCLEASYTEASEMTVKDKISRVLLVNAYAYDTEVWADLVQRHLDEVDRSDPNIAFLYAYFLHNRGVGSAEEVIQWTQVGLERKHDWTGEVYVSRVYSLMKLRAIAAGMVWEDAEKTYSAGGGKDKELQAAMEKQRNRTKTFAREWLDFATVAGRDVEEPRELCISAASERACSIDTAPGDDAPSP